MSNRTWPHMENPNREQTHTLYTHSHSHTLAHQRCSVEKLNNYALALGLIKSSLLCIYSNFAQHLVHMEPVSIKCQGVREHRIASTRLDSTIDQSGVERTSIMRNLKEINVVQEITFRSSIFGSINTTQKKRPKDRRNI